MILSSLTTQRHPSPLPAIGDSRPGQLPDVHQQWLSGVVSGPGEEDVALTKPLDCGARPPVSMAIEKMLPPWQGRGGLVSQVNAWSEGVVIEDHRTKSRDCAAAARRTKVHLMGILFLEFLTYHLQRHKTQLSQRVCHRCQEKRTPQWRHGPDGPKTLCNLCGLLYTKRIERASKRELAPFMIKHGA